MSFIAGGGIRPVNPCIVSSALSCAFHETPPASPECSPARPVQVDFERAASLPVSSRRETASEGSGAEPGDLHLQLRKKLKTEISVEYIGHANESPRIPRCREGKESLLPCSTILTDWKVPYRIKTFSSGLALVILGLITGTLLVGAEPPEGKANWRTSEACTRPRHSRRAQRREIV